MRTYSGFLFQILLVIFLIAPTADSHAGLFDKLKGVVNAASGAAKTAGQAATEAASRAANSCGSLVTSATSAYEKAEILKNASETAQQILVNAKELINQIGELACTTGNCSVVFSTSLVRSLPGLAWRVFRFDPNPKGIRDGVVFPLIDSLQTLRQAKDNGSAIEISSSISKLMSLLVEITLKAQKIAVNEVAATRVSVNPVGLGTGLILPEAQNSYPTLASHLISGIVTQMRKALFTGGLPLRERIMMLADYELMFLRSLKEMGSVLGIQDIDRELSAWRKQNENNSSADDDQNSAQ